MAKRAGPSISVKMILTSTLLLILVVLGFGWMSVRNLEKVYDKKVEDKIAQFKTALIEKGSRVNYLLAQGTYNLLENTQLGDVPNFVEQSIGDDDALKLIYIADRNQKMVYYCQVTGDSKKPCNNGGYPDRKKLESNPGLQLPPIKEKSFAKAIVMWKLAAKTKDKKTAASGVVTFELTTADLGRAQFVVYPVFAKGTKPSAAKAAATDLPQGRYGYVVTAYDLTPIEAFSRESNKEKKEAADASKLRTGAFGALFVLIGTVMAIFQGLRISKPIKLLAWKADQIARGDLEARVEVTSTDEIGLLGENFNFMADQIVVLLHQTAEKAHMEKELEVARTIQETLVPPNDPIDAGPLQFAGYFQPASQCGGDWWTYHELVGHKMLIVIGDVTGHGVPSAMITATAKAACDVARTVNDNDVSVTTVLEIMNDAIFQSAKRKFVMTCFASVVDLHTHTITYANAGHNFPYLYRVNEERGRGEFGSLMIRGNRLGDLKDSKYEAKTQQLERGDTIIWYTDGIVECESETGEEYGEKRFRASIRRAGHLAAGEIRDNVVNEAMNFYGQMPRKDDITMVIGRIT